MTEDRKPMPRKVRRLYLLGFRAGTSLDLVAYPVFWWELRLLDADAAEALNRDVARELYQEVTIKL